MHHRAQNVSTSLLPAAARPLVPPSGRLCLTRAPAAATELAAVDSGHPDPNGLRQEPRVILSLTPVVAAFHLVAETTKTTIAAALLVAAGQNSGELTWPS